MPLVKAPDHADTMTPADARTLALQLISLADTAEGLSLTDRPVPAWEVVAELAHLRDEIGLLRSERQDYWTAQRPDAHA